MNNVQQSLNQYMSLIGNETRSNDLHQMAQTTDTSEKNSSTITFSRKANEFLEKFEKRKHNQLLKLSISNVLPDTKSIQIEPQPNIERLLDPQPT